MNGEHEHFVLGTARGWTASMMVVTGEAEDAGDGALLAKGEVARLAKHRYRTRVITTRDAVINAEINRWWPEEQGQVGKQ